MDKSQEIIDMINKHLEKDGIRIIRAIHYRGWTIQAIEGDFWVTVVSYASSKEDDIEQTEKDMLDYTLRHTLDIVREKSISDFANFAYQQAAYKALREYREVIDR